MAETPIKIELYPDAVLPKKGWPQEMSVKSVIDFDIENVLVARRVVGSMVLQSHVLRNRRFLKQDVLDSFIDEDLSMNMIGGGFLAIHSRFKPINNADRPWDGVDGVEKEEIEGSIVEDTECFPATYVAYNLHARSVPYYKSYNSDKEVLTLIDRYSSKLQDIIPQSKKIQYVGSIELAHKPTICNYWHVTLNYRTADGILLTDHKKWKKNFVKGALKIYMEEIVPDPETYTQVFINPLSHA